MQVDIRESPLYKEAESVSLTLLRPGTGSICDASEVCANGSQAAFSGTLVESLSGVPATRICLTDLFTGNTRVLTFGPNIDRSPKFSPDGTQIAFLSDRRLAGDFQLYLLDPQSGVALPGPTVVGWVEYLHWSPDGKSILLGVAGHGADISGGQGAITSNKSTDNVPSWMPAIETGDMSYHWRSAWVYDVTTKRVHKVTPQGSNVWEAVWCGCDTLVAVVSPTPGEGQWYSACLALIEIASGNSRDLYTPRSQLGWPSASPSGEHAVVVEAICSDRWVVAGDLRLIETASGKIQLVETHGVDVSHTEWRSNQTLLLAGHRGFETVVGLYDVATATFTETWISRDITTAGFHVTVSGIDDVGSFVLVGESFVRAPEIAIVQGAKYSVVKSFDPSYADHARAIECVERVYWKAPDGLEIQGWFLLPKGQRPHPTIVCIHGGPVALSRARWLGRSGVHLLMLLKRGFAIFFPNPRGSSGRGQNFARQVLGDLGGAETADHLSGLDHLIDCGLTDPARLGVTGVSHGGFMTSWLITQTDRFAAAVSVAPFTNQVTQHLISNIPNFVSLFLADTYTNPAGKYFERSPIMHAYKARTPILNICGARDRCTPPEEALQFHNALRENGVESVLITYPEEGHGIRKFPAAIDYAARVVAWFEEHIPAAIQPC